MTDEAEEQFGFVAPIAPLDHAPQGLVQIPSTLLTQGPVTNSEKSDTNHNIDMSKFDNMDQASIYESVAELAVDEEMDDEFADALIDNFNAGTRILIVTDCCHSGSIVNGQKSGSVFFRS